MSTTFEVFPGSTSVPRFADLISVGEAAVSAFLLRHTGRTLTPKLTATLIHHKTGEHHPVDPSAPSIWNSDTTAWFTIPGVCGGTDADFRNFNENDREIWTENLRDAKFAAWTPAITTALEIGHYWSFRRSAGQPGIIAITYGLLAASLSQLTHGFVFSDDSAWEYERFPAEPIDFMSWYFDPTQTRDAGFAEWAQRCIGEVVDELDALS